jgi:hypothetical protein
MKSRVSRLVVIFFALIAAFAMSLSSCIRMGENSIKLPTNPVLTGGLGWAVVKESYVRLKESPAASAKDINHLRRGGVFRLDERELGPSDSGTGNQGSPEIWYKLEAEGTTGWARGEELDIYASQAQAEKAQAAYK